MLNTDKVQDHLGNINAMLEAIRIVNLYDPDPTGLTDKTMVIDTLAEKAGAELKQTRDIIG